MDIDLCRRIAEATPSERHRIIEELRTPAGGYTRATATRLGVPWPLAKGWKSYIVQQGYARGNKMTTRCPHCGKEL